MAAKQAMVTPAPILSEQRSSREFIPSTQSLEMKGTSHVPREVSSRDDDDQTRLSIPLHSKRNEPPQTWSYYP